MAAAERAVGAGGRGAGGRGLVSLSPTPRWVHGLAVTLMAATLLLIAIGASVTSTGSGLAVPDWPLSFGQVFPPMVGGRAVRAQPSHGGGRCRHADRDVDGRDDPLGTAGMAAMGVPHRGAGGGAAGAARRHYGAVAVADGDIGQPRVPGAGLSLPDRDACGVHRAELGSSAGPAGRKPRNRAWSCWRVSPPE